MNFFISAWLAALVVRRREKHYEMKKTKTTDEFLVEKRESIGVAQPPDYPEFTSEPGSNEELKKITSKKN